MSKESIKRALEHRNVYGAGAEKRRSLSPEDRQMAVFKEGYRGTLHAGGSGKIVTDPKQIAAISYSERNRG